MTKRLEFIDLTKLIAIILIVISHANILNNSLNIFVTSFYICVFFVCSGYTFNKSKIGDRSKLAKQLIKIVKYYLFYSFILLILFTVLSILNHTFSINNLLTNIGGIFYSRYSYERNIPLVLLGVGNAPMWFLTCYLLTYVLFYLSFKIIDKRKYLLVLFLVIGYLLSLFDILLPWSIDTVFYMCIFMFLGYYLKEYKVIDKINNIQLLFMFIVLAFMTCISLPINLSIKIYGLNYFYTFIMGVIGSLMLIALCNKLINIKLFKDTSVLGKYTIDIMCYHLVVIYVVSLVIKNVYIGCLVSVIIILLLSRLVNYVVKKVLKA